MSHGNENLIERLSMVLRRNRERLARGSYETVAGLILDELREEIDAFEALCIDAQNNWRDPHTLEHARDASQRLLYYLPNPLPHE